MPALVYDAGRRLRERDKVVVDYEDGPGEAYGRLLLGGRAFDIVRTGQFGWRFALVAEGDRSTVLSFLPSRLRRGGRILGSEVEIALHPRWFGFHRWRLKSSAGWRAQAHMRVGWGGGERRSPPGSERPVGAVWPGASATVELDGLETAGLSIEAPLALAFACWLLVEAESQQLWAAGGGGG